MKLSRTATSHYLKQQLAESQKREAELQVNLDHVSRQNEVEYKAVCEENTRLREALDEIEKNGGSWSARHAKQALAAKEKTCAHEMCRGADKCVLD